MTKNEIKFLIESGFTLSEVVAMGSADPAETVTVPMTDPEPSIEPAPEPSTEPTTEPEPDNDDRLAEFRSSIESLQAEMKKLGERIAAQGVNMSSRDTTVKSIDEALADLGRKINGG